MSVSRFLFLDTLGATIWAALLAYIGFLFSDELVEVAARFAELGGVAAAIVIGLFALFLAVKLWQRQLFLRTLKMRQLHPREVNAKLESGEPVYVVDLRHHLDFNVLPYTVPGALRVESPRVFRRLFCLSQAAIADSSSWR